MHGKNLCVHGEDAKRLLAYSHTTPRDIKVRISQLIIIRIKIFFMFFLSTLESMRTWRRRKETLGVFSYYAKRHKSAYISVNKNTN
jgi:hypothetical protein